MGPIDIGSLWFTQRRLSRAEKIPKLIELVLNGDYFNTPIELQEWFDGELEIVNGHHRVVALWLAGFRQFRSEDYRIYCADESLARFWRVCEFEKYKNLVPWSNGRA